MKRTINTFIGRFTVLRGAPRELWVIYVAKLLEIISYGLMSMTVTLWLSSDLGLTDTAAGDTVAIWSTLITLVTLLVGSLVDSIGIRRSFLLGFIVCLLTRGIIFSTTIKWLAIPFGLMVMAVGEAMMVPVMTAGVKKYSNVKQRSMAFSMYYVLMNVGFLLAGLIFDELRSTLGEYGSYSVPILNWTISTYRTIFLVGFLVTIPGLLFTWLFLRPGVTMTEGGLKIESEKPRYADVNVLVAMYRLVTETARDTIRIFVSVWKEKNFYKFLLFLTLVVFIRLVFYHMHFTFPKYGIRELGEGAPVGRLWSVLNPGIIILLVPIIGALSQKITSYTMIAVGTTLAAAPVFLLAMPPEWFQPLADGWLGSFIAHTWLGVEGAVNPLYVSITLFVVIFSVGEAFWSPRLYEYTASIAPKGKVGSYMALSLLPYFVAKLGVGFMSGRLLEAFCPATGPRNSQALWLIIACMAAICPIGIISLRKYVRSEEEGRGGSAPATS